MFRLESFRISLAGSSMDVGWDLQPFLKCRIKVNQAPLPSSRTLRELSNHVEKFSSLSSFPIFALKWGWGWMTRRRIIVQNLLTFRVSLTSCLMSFWSSGRFGTRDLLYFFKFLFMQSFFLRLSNFPLSLFFSSRGKLKLKIEPKFESKVELKSLFVGD